MKKAILALALLFAGAHAHADTAIGSSGSWTPASANSCATGKVCIWYDSVANKLKLNVATINSILSSTFQDVYNNGGAGPQVITLDSTRGGIRIIDNAIPTGVSLFSVMDNAQAVFYFRLTTSGGSRLTTPSPTSGTGFAFDTVNDFTGLGTKPWAWLNQGNTLMSLAVNSGTATQLRLGGAGSIISEVGGGTISSVYTSMVSTNAPTTLTSGATITPTQSVHYVSGTTTISTIAVGSLASNFSGQITLIPTGSWSTSTGGNIANVINANANVPVVATYDSGASKWYLVTSSPALVWTAPSLLNSWVNYGTNIGTGETYNNAAYWKDGSSRVWLQGVVKSGSIGSGTPIFNLPAGYRPGHSIVVIVNSNNAVGSLDITPSGDVYLISGSNTFVSFDGINFSVIAS